MNALSPISEVTAIKAQRFVSQFYLPANDETEVIVEAFRVRLHLQNRVTSLEAICGWLVALQSLRSKEEFYLGWPHNKSWYERGRDAWKTCRDKLVEKGYLCLARKGYKDIQKGLGSCTVYYVQHFPDIDWDNLRFKQTLPTRLVTVRKFKSKFKEPTDQDDDGHVLTEAECIKLFGDAYHIEKLRMNGVIRTLSAHPFVIDGKSYEGLQRKFNDGRLDRGGRFYAGYCSLPKTKINPDTGEVTAPRQTATIDGEHVVQLDLSSSFLCIVAGTMGQHLDTATDQYQKLKFVGTSKESREFAKILVASIISSNGQKKRFTSDMRKKYGHIIKKHSFSYFRDEIFRVFPFLSGNYEGLEIMFIESDIICRTIVAAGLKGIAAWPLHDAVFVKVSEKETVKRILEEKFEERIGFLPRITDSSV